MDFIREVVSALHSAFTPGLDVSALYWLCLPDREDVNGVRQLLSSTNDTLVKSQIEYCDKNGLTALILAAFRGHESTLKLLLADERMEERIVNHQDKDGHTALIGAAFKGREKTVKLLLADDRVEEKDVNHQDNHGNTALIGAALNGLENTLKTLLEDNRTDVNIMDNNEKTALTYAIEKKFSQQTIDKIKAAAHTAVPVPSPPTALAEEKAQPILLDAKEAAPQMSTPDYDSLRLAIPPRLTDDSKAAALSEHTVYIVPKKAMDPFAETNASNAIDDLFRQLTKTPWRPLRPIVIGIFGNPGCGKNVLVRRFALRLWQHYKEHGKLTRDKKGKQIPYKEFYAEHNCAPMTTVESLSKFMGASRGIKGGEGDLIRQIRAGAQVFCLDELDKAHHTIIKSCGSLFEDGYLSDNSSSTVECQRPTFFFILGNAKAGTDQADLIAELESMKAFHETKNQLKPSNSDVRKKLAEFRKAMFPGDFAFIGSRCHSVLLQYKSTDELYYQKLALRHIQEAVKQMVDVYEEESNTRAGWTEEVLVDATKLVEQEIKSSGNREIRGRIVTATVDAWPEDENESSLLQEKFKGGHVMVLCRADDQASRGPLAWRFGYIEETEEVKKFCAEVDKKFENEPMPNIIDQLEEQEQQPQQNNAMSASAAGSSAGSDGGSDIDVDYKHEYRTEEEDAEEKKDQTFDQAAVDPTVATIAADVGKVLAKASQNVASMLNIGELYIRTACIVLLLAWFIIMLLDTTTWAKKSASQD
jgi:Ankyrin repeats (3 copies)/AAA domain (dynein-related subfamily)/Ankyrin repeat